MELPREEELLYPKSFRYIPAWGKDECFYGYWSEVLMLQIVMLSFRTATSKFCHICISPCDDRFNEWHIVGIIGMPRLHDAREKDNKKGRFDAFIGRFPKHGDLLQGIVRDSAESKNQKLQYQISTIPFTEKDIEEAKNIILDLTDHWENLPRLLAATFQAWN